MRPGKWKSPSAQRLVAIFFFRIASLRAQLLMRALTARNGNAAPQAGAKAFRGRDGRKMIYL